MKIANTTRELQAFVDTGSLAWAVLGRVPAVGAALTDWHYTLVELDQQAGEWVVVAEVEDYDRDELPFAVARMMDLASIEASAVLARHLEGLVPECIRERADN